MNADTSLEFADCLYNVSDKSLYPNLDILKNSDVYSLGIQCCQTFDEAMALHDKGYGNNIYQITLKKHLRVEFCDDCYSWCSLELIKQFFEPTSEEYNMFRNEINHYHDDTSSLHKRMLELVHQYIPCDVITYISLDIPYARHRAVLLSSSVVTGTEKIL